MEIQKLPRRFGGETGIKVVESPKQTETSNGKRRPALTDGYSEKLRANKGNAIGRKRTPAPSMLRPFMGGNAALSDCPVEVEMADSLQRCLPSHLLLRQP